MNNYTDMFLEEKSPVLDELGKIVAKAAYYNFEWRYVTLVMVNALQIIYPLQSFLENYDQSIIFKFGKYIPHIRATIPQFVIFGQDCAEIIDMIRWLDKSKYDTSGKYIIVCTTNDVEKCNEKQLFVILAEVSIVNVIYFRSNGNNTTYFSYDKIIPGQCRNTLPYSKAIQYDCTADKCFKSLFPLKLRNFYKCPLIISTFDQPPFMYIDTNTTEPFGADGEVLKFLGNVLNATLVIKTQTGGDWGHYENNNWTGSLGDVYNDRVHASVCFLPLTANKYGNFQISFPYNNMDIVWTAQLPMQMPSWENLLNPFKLSIRVTIFIIFTIITLVNSFTKTAIWNRIRKVLKIPPPRQNLLFYSWLLFLGQPLIKLPKNRSLLVLICCWVWFCFIIRNGYQAALISSLKKRIYEEYLTNFDMILERKYKYGGPANLREYYASDLHIYKNWKTLDLNETYETLDKISRGKSDFILAFNKDAILQHLAEYNNSRNLQIIPEKIINSPTVLYFKKFSSLVASINPIISSTIEAGLTQLMQKQFIINGKIFCRTHDPEDHNPLTIHNVHGCFVMLLSFWIIALIFFVVEICCGQLKRYN